MAIASIAGGVAALAAASMLGVAAAEAPTTNPTRTVSVQGVATVPVDQGANASQANAAYRLGMTAAIADGHEKAEFLSSKAGAAPGAVQSIVEDGGYISCTTGEEGSYAEYRGEQPDFGASTRSVTPLSASSQPATKQVRPQHPRKVRRRKAKVAGAASCTLKAQVSLSYALG